MFSIIMLYLNIYTCLNLYLNIYLNCNIILLIIFILIIYTLKFCQHYNETRLSWLHWSSLEQKFKNSQNLQNTRT